MAEEALAAPAKAAAPATGGPASSNAVAGKPVPAKAAGTNSPAGAAPNTAAARRATRALQARWLLSCAGGAAASHSTLSTIEWSDLGQLPDWVFAEPESMALLIAHVGACAHAAALRQCIDGRLLAAVRGRIGDMAFVSLMIPSGEASAIAARFAEGAAVDAVLDAMDDRARAVLLGSIAHGALREAVRERLWPAAPPLLRPDAVEHAQALVATAQQHLAEQGVAR